MSLRRLCMLFCLAFSAASQAHEIKAGDLLIDHPWAPPSIGQAKSGVVYLRIINKGAKADRLLSASTPAAARAELHVDEMTDGIMRMRQLNGIDLPAGGSVALSQGGMHLMLFDLAKPLHAGFGFPVTLQFAHAGPVEVMVAIEKPAAGRKEDQHAH